MTARRAEHGVSPRAARGAGRLDHTAHRGRGLGRPELAQGLIEGCIIVDQLRLEGSAAARAQVVGCGIHSGPTGLVPHTSGRQGKGGRAIVHGVAQLSDGPVLTAVSGPRSTWAITSPSAHGKRTGDQATLIQPPSHRCDFLQTCIPCGTGTQNCTFEPTMRRPKYLKPCPACERCQAIVQRQLN